MDYVKVSQSNSASKISEKNNHKTIIRKLPWLQVDEHVHNMNQTLVAFGFIAQKLDEKTISFLIHNHAQFF